MRGRRTEALFALLALTALLGSRPALADESRKDPSRLVPHYRRQPPSVRTVAKPPSPEVPPHLRLARISLPHRTVPGAVPQNPTAPESKDPVETSRPLDRRPPPRVGPSDAEVQESAFDAADWAAHEVARTMGWREYYRAGLYDGQRSALADAGLGRAEYEEGRRAGRFDPAVRDVGSYEGSRAAEAMARREAPRQVERQFLDLTWAMIPSPRPPIVAFDEPLSPSAEPSLEEVFHDFPYTGGFWASPRLAEAYHGWSFDPWRLYQCANHTAFFDAGWPSTDRGWRRFFEDPRRAAYYESLSDSSQRALFERSFEEQYAHCMASLEETLLGAAYAAGYEDGFVYGAFLRAEWNFRRGYVAGFDEGVEIAAAAAFDRSYQLAYAQAYDDSYREWAGTARPAILGVRLRDANDDGVFQPGESLEADYELANLGGTSGHFRLSLEGTAITTPPVLDVKLPPRERLASAEPLQARLLPTAAAPARTRLMLRLGGESRPLDLLVSFPLEFGPDVPITSDPLRGRARLVVEVVNRSRKPVDGVVVARHPFASTEPGDRRGLDTLSAGQRTLVSFDLEGLRPLDLLGGSLSLDFSVDGAGTEQDRKKVDFPNLATDTANPSVLDYVLVLARSPDPDPRDTEGVRRLLLQRLETDWMIQAREPGNPYKEDDRDGGTRSAMGELVRTLEAERSTFLSPYVVNGLSEEVIELSERLPGTHPFLRKAFRRLARRLD